jgi:hypothetical protein
MEKPKVPVNSVWGLVIVWWWRFWFVGLFEKGRGRRVVGGGKCEGFDGERGRFDGCWRNLLRNHEEFREIFGVWGISIEASLQRIRCPQEILFSSFSLF